MDELKDLYYNPRTGYQSARKMKKKLEQKGIKLKLKDIQKWINNQEVNQLVKAKDISNSFIPRYPLHQLQIDLIYFTGLSKQVKLNKGNKYGLSVIDVFTKLGNVYLLKDKTADSVLIAMKQVLKDFGIPTEIYSDFGTEFVNKKFQKLMKDNNILFVGAKRHAAFVEVFNKTIKTRISKYLIASKSKTIVNILDKIIDGYNDSYHSVIGMAPNEVDKTNMHIVQKNIIKNSKRQRRRSKLEQGDKVRILKKFKTVDKGFNPRYSKIVYTVEKVKREKDVDFYHVSNGKKYLRSELLKIDKSEEYDNEEELETLLEGTLEGRLKKLAKADVIPVEKPKFVPIAKTKGKRKVRKPRRLDL